MSFLFDTFSVGCDKCPLKKEWPKLAHPKIPIIPPEKETPYRVLIIGEAPGEEEDRLGIPFVGKSGQYLRGLIPREWQDKFYITNMARCRPPGNRTPSEQEVYSCTTGFLEPDLIKLRPHAILALGDVAASFFVQDKSISRIRGLHTTIQLADGTPTWFSSTFHPSYVMRSGRDIRENDKKVNVVEPLFKTDIAKFFARVPFFAENPPPLYTPPKGKILYPKSAEEALNLFFQLKEPFGYDIETTKLKPYERDAAIATAAFSDGDLTFAMPVDWPGMLNKWGIEAFKTMLRSKRRWIAHNAAFELLWTWSVTGTHDLLYEDTMVLGRIHQQRSMKLLDLETVTLLHLGVDVKSLTRVDSKRLLQFPLEEVLEYNAYDAWGCFQLFNYYADYGNFSDTDIANYSRTLKSIKSVTAMEKEGLEVSLDETEKLNADLLKQEEELDARAAELPEVKQFERDNGKMFSLTSPQMLAKCLTQYCRVDLPKTESGSFTTVDDVLEKFSGAHPLVDLTLDSREVRTQRSRYVTPIITHRILGADYKLHPNYTTTFTATWRLSSEYPNIQNFPKRKHREIRRQIVAPPGYVLASFDYGQLEARVLVMASNDNVLRKQFINHDDIHSKWLNRVIEIYPPYFDRLREKTNQVEEKAILKAGRDIIKTDFVFASFYGSIASSIANRALLPLSIANQLLEEFWGEYRGVRKWIDKQFRLYQETGTVVSLTGRIRNQVLKGHEPINSAIQGTGAEIVLEAQTALMEKGLSEDICFLPRINVHDDLTFILPDNSDLPTYCEVIAKEIVQPRFDFITLPLMTEGKIGKNWCELEEAGKWEGSYFQYESNF